MLGRKSNPNIPDGYVDLGISEPKVVPVKIVKQTDKYIEVKPIVANWKEQLSKIEQCPQRQDSVTDQMIDLYYIANKLGFYDAADYIKRTFTD